MAVVSVIVPVYKAENYICKCVDSILSQTFADFELLLVDDGSPDNCGSICDDYAEKDSRIHVIHQKNGGLSAARNAGLDWLKDNRECQWVTFVDSDDWIHKDTLQLLLRGVQTVDTKISICGYQETAGEMAEPESEACQVTVWSPETFYQKHLINATVTWGKLYHWSCFETLRFPVGKIHEDEYTTYRILFDQEKIAVIHAPLYAYYINNEGITRGTWSPRRLDAWEAYEQQLAFFQEKGYGELYRFRLQDYLQNALLHLEWAEKTPGVEKKTISFIRRRICRLIRQCWHTGLLRFQYDFAMLVRFYPITTRVYRFYTEKIRRVT